MPFAANAAGLGKLTVVSGLGEPLSAEIELLSTTAEELSSLTAAIAPEEAYSVQGVERTAIHNSIKIEVVRRPNGNPILKLSTRQPISDPFLDMLIQVDWSTGRLLREYTVLLDPPGYTNQTTASPSSPATATSIGGTENDVSKLPPLQEQVPLEGATDSRSGKSSGKKKSAGVKSKSAPVVSEAAPVSEGTGLDHTTVRGDTLSGIALQNQVEGVSLDQMLVGLYRANKEAFSGGNMNRLKVGQIVRIPSAEELQSISRSEASQEVRVQTADWQAYRNKLAGIVAESTAGSEESGSQATGGKISAPAEDKAAAAPSGPRDVVKLSKSDTTTDKKAAAGDAKAMQDKLNSLQEEVTAREKGLKEADERTAMLEKQIADMQKLLAVKNQTMADAQKSAAVQNQAKPEAAAPAAPQPAKVETPAAPAPAASVPATPAEAAAPTPAAPPAAEAKKPEAAPEKKPAPVAAAPAPVAEEPGLFDFLFENPIILGALGGIVLLSGGWLFMRNRRKHNLDGFEQGILTSGGLKANTVFGNTTGGTVDTGDTSFLTDFSQSSGGMIDTHDVDPIAEAEVYMAYGRDSQAEEILKDAISKEPKRYELHLKLLEILASRKDTSGFETLAGELYAQLGATDPVWAKVAEIGHKLEPSNPLYQASAVAAGAAVAAAASSQLEASDFADAEVMTESSLDFSLDSDESAPKAETESTEAAGSLDFDLGMGEPAVESINEVAADPAPIEAPSMSAALDSGPTISMDMNEPTAGLDFQLDLPEQAAESNNQLDMADLGTLPSFDIGEPAAAPDLGMDLSESPAPEDTVQLDVTDFGNTMPNLEAPTFDMPAAQPVSSIKEDADLTEISFDLPEMPAATTSLADAEQTISMDMQDFDKTMLIQPEAAQEISFEAVAEADNVLDLNFGELEATPAEAAVETAVAVPANPPELDLSGISLDLGDAPAPADSSTVADSAISADFGQFEASAQEESDEVNTKLDLVTAYMEIGDNEGARELLDEVMKEGGPKQLARAKEILATLG